MIVLESLELGFYICNVKCYENMISNLKIIECRNVPIAVH